MNDNDSNAFEALVLRVHCRRIAHLCKATGRDLPPGVAAYLADDGAESIEADNRTYGEWCQSHGVEAFTICWLDWDGTTPVSGPPVLGDWREPR